MQAYLKKHGPSFQAHNLKISFERKGRLVIIDFEMQKRLGVPWQTDPNFSTDYLKNWGLWNKDVVEAFLQLRSHEGDVQAPYLEVQVSPLNQPFALIIKEPRKVYYPPENLIFKTEVTLTDKLWTGKLEVELPPDLTGDSLYGGFYACVSADPREYYALQPNIEVAPDFHRPELFLLLDEA